MKPGCEIETIVNRLVVSDNGCLVWPGARWTDSYGKVVINKKVRRVHRLIYELVKGIVPKGLCLDHLCENKLCANPNHLEAVTVVENLRRWHLRRTHCYKGHPLKKSDDGSRYHCPGCREEARIKRHKPKRDVCPNGHPYTEANTGYRNGGRSCRECERARDGRQREKVRQKDISLGIVRKNLAEINAEKTHCPQGHPYEEGNVRVREGRGGRECLICRREYSRRRKMELKLKAQGLLP